MTEQRATTCCIAGGGPAGMMLGLLLARAGVEVVVLEKHADFLRDFRGDTIHPSTLEVMHELGMLDDLLKLPHQKVPRLNAQFGELTLTIADFSGLPTHCRFIAMMPQWDFLNFLAERAARYPGFRLIRRVEATGVIEEAGRVVGLRAATGDRELEIRAALVVGADGRHSAVRDAAGLEVEEIGAPMDVLWFSLSRRPGDPEETMGRFDAGRIFVLINRGTHWQCGYVIAKGSLEQVRNAGLDHFRVEVARLAPFAAGRVARDIGTWDDVKLLTVGVNRVKQWHRPGLLCIGDAAHTMSPVGGVGINLAIQDAVATANILAEPLRAGTLTDDDLARVQDRRGFPTWVTQRVQVMMQNAIIQPVLGAQDFTPPFAVRAMARIPALRRIPARMFGLGVRPEHVRSPVA